MKPLALLTLAALLAPFTFPAPSAEPPRKLNVLFIVVDDLNTDLGSYGHPRVKTPNIDRLAARGVRFDRAYCQYPLCMPSRASFLSGLRPATTGVFDNSTPPRTRLKDAAFLPEYFRQHGYFTAGFGKIEHREQPQKWDLFEIGPAKAAGGARGKTLAEDWRATDDADEQTPDGRNARRIVEVLSAPRERPFFIAAGLHKPHQPFHAPKKYFALYPDGSIALPDEPASHTRSIPPIALTYTAPPNEYYARLDDKTAAEKQRIIAAYDACISFADAQVGVLLEAMDRLKLWDDTVVVLFGDHGFHLGEHDGMWCKMSLFEESARVPLIVAAPGRKAGSASPRLVELVDLYPTLAALCGLPPPEGLEGTSFLPLLDRPERPWKKAAFTVVTPDLSKSSKPKVMGRSVRTERWRYTQWDDDLGSEVLFDHQADPREWTNLAADPAQAGVMAEMRQLLKDGWKGVRP